jgi:acyl carrier protein
MNELHRELKSFLIETMNLEDITADEIGDDMPLFSPEGLGLDSIDALELVLALKKNTAS